MFRPRLFGNTFPLRRWHSTTTGLRAEATRTAKLPPPPRSSNSHQSKRPPPPPPPPPPKHGRLYRTARLLVVVGSVGTIGYVVDNEFNASALTRSARALTMGLICTLDYKINFNQARADEIEQLHERVAQRFHNLIVTNQGLWIKAGQALGLQAALLPKPYREAFADIFDDAPTIPYDEVEKVFRQDCGGKSPDEVFDSFEHQAVNSASIAQVHRAKVRRNEVDKNGKPTGKSWLEDVAVKIQKPAIRKQVDYDLWCYRFLSQLAEKLFDMPVAFVADYVSQQMRLETNFLHEAENAQKCAEYLAKTPELRDKVYVPQVYPEVAGTERVMVMEYVKGCKITDSEEIEAMGFTPREVMDTMIATMSAMTFKWGFVHCDPHPGNILVRPHPSNPKKPQVILLDHGLYQELPGKFRKEYTSLWKSLFTVDTGEIQRVAKEWGINLDVNLFASAITLRPFQVTKDEKQLSNEGTRPAPKTEYELQVELKERLQGMLESQEKIPRELIFVGRAQRIIQALNQIVGSPSPRLNITAHWAYKGWYDNQSPEARSLRVRGLTGWMSDRADNVVFRFALLLLDFSFWSSRIRQWWYKGSERGKKGWEDDLNEQFATIAESYGIAWDQDPFLG